MYTLFATRRDPNSYFRLIGDPIPVAVYRTLDETCEALRRIDHPDYHWHADFTGR